MVAEGTRGWLRVARYEGNFRMQAPSLLRYGFFREDARSRIQRRSQETHILFSSLSALLSHVICSLKSDALRGQIYLLGVYPWSVFFPVIYRSRPNGRLLAGYLLITSPYSGLFTSDPLMNIDEEWKLELMAATPCHCSTKPYNSPNQWHQVSYSCYNYFMGSNRRQQ